MTLPQLADHTSQEFSQVYGRKPVWIAAAPGRVNIIGEHTDYNDGFVLPMGIERYTVIAAAPAPDAGQITLRSTINPEPVTIRLGTALKPLDRGAWVNYPTGVIAGFLSRGIQVPAFDALIHSTVPLGGGLSSSAALEVATATLLETITDHRLDPVEKALLCQKAEHAFAGVPCGIMDQFVSAMGREDHLLLLDCRTRKTELVPMADPTVSVLITNTNVKHELSGGEYAARRKQCESAAQALGVTSLRNVTLDQLEVNKNKLDDLIYRRARHVVGEIDRTPRAAEGIRRGDWLAVGRHMYASHYSLKDDYEVSCPELDAVVEITQGIGPAGGVIGCRMTGGGFGGCTVALVKADAAETITRKITADYLKRTGIHPTIFTTRPAAGATVLKS